MNVSKTRQDVSTLFGTRLQRRVMLRIMPILAVTFLVITLFSFLTIRSSRRNELREDNARTMIALNEETRRSFDRVVEDASDLSESLPMREFAVRYEDKLSGQESSALLNLQQQLLSTFDDLIGRNLRYYEFIRYVHLNNEIILRVENLGGYTDVRSSLLSGNALSLDATIDITETMPLVTGLNFQAAENEFSVITLSRPVFQRGTSTDPSGMIQIGFSTRLLADAQQAVLDDTRFSQEGRRALLVDVNGRVLADTGSGSLDAVTSLLNTTNDGFSAIEIGNELYVSAEPFSIFTDVAAPWRVVLIDDWSAPLAAANRTATLAVLGLLGSGLLVTAILGLILRRMLMPLSELGETAVRLAGDNAPELTEPTVTAHRDEVDDLAVSMRGIRERITGLSESIKAEAQRRNRDLEVAASIGREVATLYDINLLLTRAINLICEGYGFYHAQVFLVDEAGINAILAHSRGRVGQTLLARNHKIVIGSESVIGTVATSSEPLIVNDTLNRGDLPFRPNPFLPETRAEMGLPLIMGERIIGVLDIHSREPNVFNDADLPTFRLLADQLAVALFHARLVRQSDERIEQIDQLNRQLTRQAWHDTGEQLGQTRGYRYNMLDIEALTGDVKHNGGIRSEIRIRNEVIGYLSAEPDRGESFSEADDVILRAVADRVALAIENARLFQETQSSLAETSTLYNLSRNLSDANTMQDILRAMIDTVLPEASSGQIWMFEDSYLGDRPDWMELVAEVSADDAPQSAEMVGLRLPMDDYLFLSTLREDQIALIQDAGQDSRVDAELCQVFEQFKLSAGVFIPLAVRGEWRGVISFGFAQPRTFTEREGRVYTALIDQAGVAIDNRLLLEQTEAEVARNESLYAASRIINTAQTMADLVYAAVATSADRRLEFRLSLTEGELDENGWPQQARLVAESRNHMAHEMDILYDLNLPQDSAMRQRVPEVINDSNPSDGDVTAGVKRLREQGFRSAIYFPLFSRNMPIAIFEVLSRDQREFSPADFEVYRAITGQMSGQIQIRGLLDRTEAALDETRRLYIASGAITEAQDAAGVYTAAVEHLAQPLITTSGDAAPTLEIMLALATPDPVPESPVLEVAFLWRNGDHQPDVEVGDFLSAEAFPFGRLARSEAAVYLPDLRDDSSNDAAERQAIGKYYRGQGMNSLLVQPIVVRQQWFGVMVFTSKTPRGFNEQFIRFAGAIADQVAIALDNQRLFEQARQEAERAQSEAQRALALAEAAQLASRIGDDFRQSLGEVFERVTQEAGFDRWMLLFLDDNQQKLEKITVHAPGFDNTQPLEYDLETTIPVVEAVRFNRRLMVNAPLQYPSFQNYGEIERQGIAHFFGKHVAVPVRIGGTPVGSLFVGRDLNREDLNERDEQLVETLAAQVAIAIENRRLFERVQREQQNLNAILETLPAGVLVLDPETLKPVQFNEQAKVYFGDIDMEVPFSNEGYRLFRTGTHVPYPEEEMSIFTALRYGSQDAVDDVAVLIGDQPIDLQVAASPVLDTEGNVRYIVAAFQDISNLRSLENTLQENLQETVTNLETQRQLADATTLADALNVMMAQTGMMLQPYDAYLILENDNGVLQSNHYLNQALEYPQTIRPLLDQEKTIHLPDLSKADLSPDVRGTLDALGAKSFLSVPLRVASRSRAVGWLLIIGDQANAVNDSHLHQLSQLVDMSSTVIDNRLLFQQQQATVNEVRMLYTATNNITRSAGDVFQLQNVLKETLETLHPDYYATYLFEEAGLGSVAPELFNEAGPGLEQVDFAALMASQEIPPWGFYVDDLLALEQPDELQQRLIGAGLRAVAAVNLRPRDLPGGFMVVGYDQPHVYSDSEERFMNTVADAASIVFNNILLFEQTQATLEETSVLYQASKALSDATGPAEIVDVVVNYLVEPHVDQVFIGLLGGGSWESAGSSIQIVASWGGENGIDLEGVTLSREQFPAWDQLSSRDVLIFSDIYNDPRLDDMAQTGIASLDARSLVVIPLQVASRPIGAVWIGSREPFIYSERDIRTFQAFAEQASLSMEASYLLQQTERRARQLETSAVVSRRASEILDLEVLLPQLVDLIRDAFGYDHVQIFMMDDRNEYAELRASTGEAGQKLLAIKHKLAKGSASVIGQVTEQSKPIIALDTADAAVVHAPNPHLPLTRSEIALPLVVKDYVVGALDVQSNLPSAFSEEDVKALGTLAAQISVAIDNARLYESATRQADRMGFLFDITSMAAGEETLDETVQAVAESIHRDMASLSVSVYLSQVYVDDQNNTFTSLQAMALAGVDQPLTEIERVRLDDRNNLLAQAGRNLRAQIIQNVSEAPGYLPITADARSAAILPMATGSDLLGLIVLEDERANAYDRDTVQLLSTLSGSLTAVLHSKRLLEQIQRTNEQLRELDRLKSDFLANMSHELRTPLNSIIGFSRVMLKGIDGPLTEMQEQDLTTIYTSGQHLLTLINDILDQAKIAADKLELKCDYFDVKPLIEAVKSIGIGLVKEKNLNLVTEIAPSLPQVYGDEVRTRQVLINLISNAAKFTQEGGITIRCYPVQHEVSGKTMIRVDVQDTGIGISEADMPLLFEAFRQIDSSLTRTQGGTGLGLPIAKSLTEMQGGEMAVVSKVNAGSTFSITIPTEAPEGALDDDPEEIEEEAPTRSTSEIKAVPPAPPQMMAKREVLLIEDNKDMVDQFRRALQREGFDVVTADHPAYAEAMASNLRPTVIVMDINFAGGKGWDILASLKDRDDTFDIPVVVVTLSNESERAYQTGVHSFIQRPFVPEDLIEAVLEAEKESNTERILIIDDHPDDVRLLKQILNDSGTYRVFTATGGKEGVSLVARRRPNLIILDLRMPEMDGFAVLDELRSNPETANIPILVVTGEVDLNADEQAILGNVRVVPKSSITETEYQQFVEQIRNELNE